MSFNFGAPKTTGGTTGFSLTSLPSTTTNIPSPMFSFASTTSAAPVSFGIAQTTAPIASSTTIASVAPIAAVSGAPKTSGFSFSSTGGQTTGFSLSNVSTTSATTAFSLGSQIAAPTTGLSLGTGISTQALPVTSTSNITSSTSLPPPTNSIASVTSTNFVQLEENINKWTIELEEQEKIFMNQVEQVNTWDRLLLSNGDKIVSLNSGVEKVLLDQQQLDHELDFILAQQRELAECLAPLEKELSEISVSDPERDSTYQIAENLNSQLKQMSEDLKEVIEHINERNKNQDSSNPIVQIGRILNAHMDSLQWIDENVNSIQQQLDQVNKLTDIYRHDNETSQNI